jgi:cytochrome c biogenesis protein CcdA/DsbC/DsbD-like thiol-disulfide interchange protein
MRRLLTLLALFLGATLASAQNSASGTLYTRVEGDLVRAAIVVELDPGFHIYHSDLGHEKAVGKPTKFTFEGSATFGPVRFPEPHKFDQSEIGEGIFILGHEGTVTYYAAGRLAAGADGSDIVAKINALVCDATGCVPYKQTLKPEGAGDDQLFAAFPADLAAPGAPPAAAAPEAAPAMADAGSDVPRKDELEKGRADGELFTKVVDGEVRAALRIKIDFGWHLYHTAEDLGKDPTGKPTVVTLHGEGITWEAPVFPAPEKLDQSDFGTAGAYIHAHSGTITAYARGALASGASGAGRWAEIRGQTCENVCVDYVERLYDRGAGEESVWSGWNAAYPVDGGAPAASVAPAAAAGEDEGLLLFLLAAIGGGLFALVMPCTYPMIPITISFFTKQAEKRGGNALGLSLAYGAGIVLIFVVIGVVFGSLIIPFSSHPVTNLVIGAAFIYFSLVLFGLVNLQPPAFLMNVAGSASQKGGYLGVFLMGATLVVTSFTCTAPFVGTLLAAGASGSGGSNLGRVALGMAAFGLTMAIPFVFLSLVPTRLKAMPRSGEWMNTLKVFMGFVELAAALKFLSNTDLVWEWEVFSRELFLLLWGVLFVGAGLFLFGVFARGMKISVKRKLGAVASVAFAGYCFWGMSGKPLDFVMTAIAPPYSGGRLGWNWYETGETWTIVVDDYDAAFAQAKAEQRLLLINLTGHT